MSKFRLYLTLTVMLQVAIKLILWKDPFLVSDCNLISSDQMKTSLKYRMAMYILFSNTFWYGYRIYVLLKVTNKREEYQE